VILVAVSLVGGFFAYRLYESGQPGNPEVSPGSTPQSGVAVYVAPGMSDGVVQDALFGAETYSYSVRLARRPAADVYLVVGFYGEAWPRGTASPLSLDGAEVLSTHRDEYGSYVAVRLSASAGPPGVAFNGTLARPVQASQNGRVAVEPPVLWPATPCAELARGASVPDLARTVLPCDTEAQFYYRASIHHADEWQAIQNQEQRVELSDLAPSSFRVDYVSPPLARPDFFTWSASGGLSVTARLVDIEGEARAQRDLFAAGVLAGLASALLLFALERSVRRVARPHGGPGHDRAPPTGRLRRRRSPRRSRPGR
jgi:hypothetical protein